VRLAVSEPLVARWLRLPGRTIRVRLTLVYGALFLLSGAALLTITYFLIAHQFTGKFFVATGTSGAVNTIVAKGEAPVGDPAGLLVGGSLAGLPPGLSRSAVVAAGNAQSNAALHTLLVDSGIALALMALLSIWLGWLVAGRALQPLRTMANTAREISASNLHRRLALAGPDDELKQLGNTFDDLLARLEASFEAQRQFVANASHELRTPLTLERALIEVALADPDADVESLRRTCEQVLAAGEQQERLIDALLTLSRGQRGIDRHEPIDLAAVAAASLHTVDGDGLRFATALAPARTTGDARLVERLVFNLVANAVHYNVPEGRVEITTETDAGHARIVVQNTGPIVPAAKIEQLFQPFERLEGARTNGATGFGLGLSIVRAIATAHDAAVTVRPRISGGLFVEVSFPAAR
jgi:signal transduction histidine kinase